MLALASATLRDAQPVNAVPQQNYAQGQQSYGQPTERLTLSKSYPPPQNGNAQTPYGSAYEPYKISACYIC